MAAELDVVLDLDIVAHEQVRAARIRSELHRAPTLSGRVTGTTALPVTAMTVSPGRFSDPTV
jgi:hypothetical protein